MLTVKRFVCNPLQENTYIVSADNGDAAIIDCGAYFTQEQEAIRQYVTEQGLRPVRLLATHAHADHNIGNAFVHKVWGLKPEVHHRDEELMQTLPQQAEMFFGARSADVPPAVENYFDDDYTISLGNHVFSVVPTPGHTPGGVFFYSEQDRLAFSGDTLFHQSVGRTDLPGGSMFMLIQSLRMVCQLPDDVVIYPGHGPSTTIGEEVAHNPYLDR